MTARARWVCSAIALGGAFAACGDYADYSESRLIDEVCATGCETQGAARQVQGLTPDSIGFELGPGPGGVTFQLGAGRSPEFSRYSIEVLLQGSGFFNGSEPHLEANYRWKPADAGIGVADRPETATVATVGEHSRAKIADLRLVDRSDDFGECSVSAPGRPRRRSLWR